MLVYKYKLDGSHPQFVAINEVSRAIQFVCNKYLRLWMDKRETNKYNLNTYSTQLSKEYPFASHLNSMVRQAFC